MNISCTRENLYQGLAVTSHLTSKNVNLPILNNVLLKTQGGLIKFTTTNLEIAISVNIRGKVDEDGEITIPSKLFFDYVSLLPNETVEMVLEDSVLRIRSGNQKTKINGLSSSEFPLVPKVDVSKTYNLPINEFKKSLSQILFAVTTNESRPELTGVCMKFSDKLVLAATDSYRLAESKVPLKRDVQEHNVIVPARTLVEVNRILSVFRDDVESPSEITLGFSDNQVVFSFGSVELVSRLIEGLYPDYTQIIPKVFQTSAILDREDAIKSVKTASLFSKQGLFDITLELNSAENQLSIKAVDSSRGENTASCNAVVTGQDNKVTVNYRYLLDGLNALNSEKVHFEMIDASNPCLITPKDANQSSDYLYIIMPIKQ